jgi:hypothetical protein
MTSIIQHGSDIYGKAAKDRFGLSLSISADGSMLVVGAPYNDNSIGLSAGQVSVYTFNSSISDYVKLMDIDGEAEGDWFGTSVSMSADGSTFIVGAPNNVGNNTYAGHVRVYKRDPNSHLYSKFGSDIDGEKPGDQFGSSVSISADGSTFVVGAPYNDAGGTSAGHVRVYKLKENVYSQIGEDVDGETEYASFGLSVSVSADGSTFAVGAPLNTDNAGQVSVYKLDENSYSQIGANITGESNGDKFGHSVSLSADGSTLVAGAPFNRNRFDSRAGQVRAFQLENNTYSLIGNAIDNESPGIEFGSTIGISADGSTLIVGVSFSSSSEQQVRVYKKEYSNNFLQIGLGINDMSTFDSSGYSVSMSSDGSTFAVSATKTQKDDLGYVRAFKLLTPTNAPTKIPSNNPTKTPTIVPSKMPTKLPTQSPIRAPTYAPSEVPTKMPTKMPTQSPTKAPTNEPTKQPTKVLTQIPTKEPTNVPIKNRTTVPTKNPSNVPPTNTPTKTFSPVATTVDPPTTKCGILGWNVFCPRRGKCGFFRRLFNINGCNE